jgi:hypothetical protein
VRHKQDLNEPISTYAGIAAALVGRKLAGASRLYDVLQHRARLSHGNAIFTSNELIDWCKAHDILSESKVRRALKGGEGLLWDTQGRTYRMRSKVAVCQTLDLPHPGWKIYLPAEAYTTGNYSAYVYSAWWHNNPNEWYRSTLCRVFNISEQTQRNWEKLTGIEVHARIATADIPHNLLEVKEYVTHANARHWLVLWDGKRIKHTVKLFDRNNEPLSDYAQRRRRAHITAHEQGCTLRIAWQEANYFIPTRTQLAPSGSSRRIAQSLKHPRYVGSQGGNRPKRFHDAYIAAKYRSKNTDQVVKVDASPVNQAKVKVDPNYEVWHMEFSYFARYNFDKLNPVVQGRIAKF